MKRFGIILFAVFSLCTITAPATHAIIVVDFDPNPVDVVAGSTFSVDLLADILPTEAVISWELDILFDNGLLSLDSVTVGAPWDVQISSDGDGLGGFRLPPFSVSGTDVLLAQLDFTCLGVGLVNLDLAADINEGFQLFPFPIGGSVDWQLASTGTINQTPIPEPATVLLVGIGLAGLGVFSRKKTKR